MSDQASKISSIRTELIVALVFCILAMIGWIFLFATSLVGISVASAVGFSVLSGFAVGYFIFALVFLVMTILVARRVWKMYSAANKPDIKTLKELNSVGWAIIALIFSGIIPGIMLLIAHGPVDELTAQ